MIRYPVLSGNVLNLINGFGVNVLNYPGVDPTGVTDSTTGIQAAETYAAAHGLNVWYPAGTYKITAPIAVSSVVFREGAGPALTQIVQYGLTSDIFQIDHAGNVGGGIANMWLRGAYSVFNGTGTSGIGLKLSNINEGFVCDNVLISNVGEGIKFVNGCYSGFFTNTVVRYVANYGIHLAVTTSGPANNDNRFDHLKIQNIGYTGSASTPIGVFIEESGGQTFTDFDILVMGNGLVIQPPTSKAVVGDEFNDFECDTSLNDNIIIDATNGFVTTIDFNACRGDFSTNGSGLVVKGSNVDSVRWLLGKLRENGQNGAHLQTGKVVIFGTEIATNSKLTTLTYHGVLVDANVSDWSIMNCKIGNFATGLSNAQLDNIHIASGSSDRYMIAGNDLSNPGSGGSPLSNSGSGLNCIIFENLPIGAGLNPPPSQTFSGSTVSTVAAAATVFLGPNGAQSSDAASRWTVNRPGTVTGLQITFTTAPGSGKNFTYTVYQNGSATAMTGAITGTSTATQRIFGAVAVARGDTLSIQLVTDSGAGVGNHSYCLEVSG